MDFTPLALEVVIYEETFPLDRPNSSHVFSQSYAAGVWLRERSGFA